VNSHDDKNGDRIAARRLEEHYADLGKQEHAVRLGMWIFLGSETLLFAGLFGLYTAYRSGYSAEFHEAVLYNNAAIGTINTVILLVSSFSVAWAVHTMRLGRTRAAAISLGVTAVLGLGFLSLKFIEYAAHIDHGILPGAHYAYEGLPGDGHKLFFTLYYFMTGLHALHVLGGIAAMLWLVSRIARAKMSPAYHPELEMGGLYWHLVDVVWIFLWPLLYLVG
jgi:cytochrome c oxidase subunit III